MLGAAGALLCLTAGTALGIYLRDRRQARLCLLRGEMELLTGMRLLLMQERLGMGELLRQCAQLAPSEPCALRWAQRLQLAAQALSQSPMEGLEGAYASACEQTPIRWEGTEERDAVAQLFAQLGSGTAAMREQAVANCLRRLKPIAERAKERADEGGRLCMRLGMLLGLMAGIALW